jgi:hypothetical protein
MHVPRFRPCAVRTVLVILQLKGKPTMIKWRSVSLPWEAYLAFVLWIVVALAFAAIYLLFQIAQSPTTGM